MTDNDSDSQQIDSPSSTLGQVVASKGLLGVLKEVGNSTMAEPQKHVRVLHDAKNHHMVKSEFPDAPKPRTLGGKLGHHVAEGDHEKAASALSGHPLTGLVGKNHMTSIMGDMSGPMMAQEPDAKAFRGSVDYLAGARRGKDLINKHVNSLFEPGKKSRVDQHNPAHIAELKQHIDALSSNPGAMLNIGGDIGHYLPDHGMQLSALSANAVQYLSSLKPLSSQGGPLDKVLEPSKSAVAKYDRQVALAQSPLILLNHAKDGTLLPDDIATVQTIYPDLYKSITDGISQHLIDTHSKGTKIPYRMRPSLSMLLGQPLDSTMSSEAMQAIIQSAGPKNGQPQGGGKAGAPKAAATALKASETANKMAETPLQARQANRKS